MATTKKPQMLRGKVALWASVLVVFVVAILLMMILIKPSGKPEPSTPVAVETPKDEGGCNVPAGDTSAKPAMPKDLRWKAEKGWTWPVSDTYGPTKTKDGFPVCFARSPLGAALAAVSTNASANLINAKKMVELYAVDSKGKDVLKEKMTDGPAMTDPPASYSGFIVDSFNENEASITLVVATAASSSGYAGLPLTFQWVDGDWKVKVFDDGSTFVGQPPTPIKGGFVEWRGTNG